MVVYKAVNKTNGKIYIGSTPMSVQTRMYNHYYQKNTNFGREFSENPCEFEIYIIDCADSLDELRAREFAYIEYYSCEVPKGYNRKHVNNAFETEPYAGRLRHLDTLLFIQHRNRTHGAQTEDHKRRLSVSAKKHRSRKVRNVDTGEVFESKIEAQRRYGLKGNSPISDAIRYNRKCAGFLWEEVS